LLAIGSPVSNRHFLPLKRTPPDCSALDALLLHDVPPHAWKLDLLDVTLPVDRSWIEKEHHLVFTRKRLKQAPSVVGSETTVADILDANYRLVFVDTLQFR